MSKSTAVIRWNGCTGTRSMLPRGDDSGGEVRHYGARSAGRWRRCHGSRKLQSTGKTLVFVYEAGPSRLWPCTGCSRSRGTNAGWFPRA